MRATHTDKQYGCTRNKSVANRGIYFIVTDQIGRAIATFDSAGKLTGASAEEHPFGKANYRLVTGETPHPETSSSELGTKTYSTWKYVTDLGTLPTGTARDVRVKFHVLDESNYTTVNYAKLVEADDSSGTRIGSQNMNGAFAGPVWTNWTAMGSWRRLDVKTVNAGSPTRCKCSPYGQSCTGCLPGTMTNWFGASLEAVEYRVRDSTASYSVWTPFLFPGQYFDEETELAENWHRIYEPATGRYLQIEPMMARRPIAATAFAYANSNPITFGDATGQTGRQ